MKITPARFAFSAIFLASFAVARSEQPSSVKTSIITVVCEVYEIPQSWPSSRKDSAVLLQEIQSSLTTGTSRMADLAAVATKTGQRSRAQSGKMMFEVEPNFAGGGDEREIDLGVELKIGEETLKAVLPARSGKAVLVGSIKIPEKDTSFVFFVHWMGTPPEMLFVSSRNSSSLSMQSEIYRVPLKSAAALLSRDLAADALAQEAAALVENGTGSLCELHAEKVRSGARTNIKKDDFFFDFEPLLSPDGALLDLNLELKRGRAELVTAILMKNNGVCFLGALAVSDQDFVDLAFVRGKAQP